MRHIVLGTGSLSLVAASILSVASMVVPTTPALAASPSEQYCKDTGGTWSKDGGKVSCTYTSTDNVGKSSNSQTVTTTDTESSNGTLNNNPKHGSSSDCDGTGNTSSPQDHC